MPVGKWSMIYRTHKSMTVEHRKTMIKGAVRHMAVWMP